MKAIDIFQIFPDVYLVFHQDSFNSVIFCTETPQEIHFVPKVDLNLRLIQPLFSGYKIYNSKLYNLK